MEMSLKLNQRKKDSGKQKTNSDSDEMREIQERSKMANAKIAT